MSAVMRTTLATLLSHYRPHPGQLLMLLLGLWVASALWSGVQAINASARESYARAEALFSSDLDHVERRDDAPLTLDDYLALRRAGVPVSPVIEGELELADGESLTLIGIEPLTLPGGTPLARQDADAASLRDWLLPPHRARVAPDSLDLARSDARLPPLEVDSGLPPATLVTDIAVAARLLDKGHRLTRLMIAPNRRVDLPSAFVRTSPAAPASPGQLADSFHLNLTAMGLLALVVGLFIVHAALGLALEQRMGLLRTLRALGVPGRTLVLALGLELLLIGTLGALLGIVSGVILARLLLPDVAATLDALYDATVSGSLTLPWHYWVGGFAITLGGLVTAGASLLWRASRVSVLALGQVQAWRARLQRQLRVQALVGGLLLGVAALLWWQLGSQPGQRELALGFTLVALLLLGTALWLPPLLGGALHLLTHRLPGRAVLSQWAVADLQLQLPRLSLAMMALLLALSANLGVGSMVGGFRLTFLDWLDQRLLADLYVRPPADQAGELHEWLRQRPEVDTLLPTRQAETRLIDERGEASPVTLFGIAPEPILRRHWPLLDTLDGREAAWAALTREAAFVNEQLARRHGLEPGDVLRLKASRGVVTMQIAAVYPDYGNPRGEIVLPVSRLAARFDAPPGTLGVVLAPTQAREQALDRLRGALAQRFTLLGDAAMIDQQALKRTATEVFERTFAITRALNALTLGVAGLALLTTLLAQAETRRAQLAPLWALGVSRGRLVGLQLVQLVGAALGTALLAIPLGLLLAGVLVAVINVAAFGWRLPLHLFPGQMLLTLVLAALVAALAALLPAWRLWRIPPRQLLQEFAAE
ncbi:putative ABC transport system permease protein [Modicisalibacter ilicicola DSM 19980]|uniref:Putative ABC transport system permease protein n=1 Tax=Modicisalibacter ilicicola DSM 19980 TaxID=1121942 RepID=A0A1M5EJV4_9GAMM|nr:ABC transporter permease [Halomonas ilicicola]SHF79529.1 putative ABC transport system permease protein [Halomonas ilicicola DSM 19980]